MIGSQLHKGSSRRDGTVMELTGRELGRDGPEARPGTSTIAGS